MHSDDVGRFAWRSALGFAAVVLGALVLAAAVRTATSPVQDVDRAVAAELNAVVGPRPWLVTTLQVLTAPGAAPTAWAVLTLLTAVLLVRRKHRLALYVAVTGLGTAVLSPLLKNLVDRLRPVVAEPVATAGGPSFPSGHTLAVTVWVGVVLLVLLPVVPARFRRVAVGVGVAVVVLVGLTRIALGVHFVSDVLAGWLVGSGWLLATATAFRAWRRSEGLAVGSAVDGLAPEVAHDLTPPHAPERAPAHPWTTAAQLVVGAVLLLGALVGIGMALAALPPDGSFLRLDEGVVAWLADHRTPALDAVTAVVTQVGDTGVVVGGGVLAALVAYVVTHRVRPPLVIAVALLGEVLIFLATAAVVGRARPAVDHLGEALPPTSSFPSGHTAAAICLYGTVAALVLRGVRAWWRWLVLAAAVLVIVAVALARLYRGAHHPTDVLASVLFAVPWLVLTLRLIADERESPPAARRARRPETVGGRR